jgi:hypothetical protein
MIILTDAGPGVLLHLFDADGCESAIGDAEMFVVELVAGPHEGQRFASPIEDFVEAAVH